MHPPPPRAADGRERAADDAKNARVLRAGTPAQFCAGVCESFGLAAGSVKAKGRPVRRARRRRFAAGRRAGRPASCGSVVRPAAGSEARDGHPPIG